MPGKFNMIIHEVTNKPDTLEGKRSADSLPSADRTHATDLYVANRFEEGALRSLKNTPV